MEVPLKRDPSRPKASDISDQEMLVAVDAFTRIGFPFPSEPFASRYPPKVVAAKLHKIHRRGLINEKRLLTSDGRAVLDAMLVQAEA